MKQIIIVLSLAFLTVSGFSQSKLLKAPVNPDYLKFIEEYESGKTEMFAAPSPYELNFDQYFKKKKGSLPKSFPVVYDMRTAGLGGTSLLTSVKHQLSCGACWAFATYGSIESVWKVMGLGDYDLSENNLKNCHGFEILPCQWGHHFMSTAYLVRGSGPIPEADDPYVPTNGSCTGGLTPTAYIPIARYLPEDHDAFKETIMNTGAVYNTYRSESGGYQWINNHYTYCYQGGLSTTHAIAIVGWDDTLSTACGQGAWIAKNEYGTGFGEDGFFYIAYQDTLVLKYNAIWSEREEYDIDLYIYQYDTIGGWPFVGYEDSIAYSLIKYVAQSDQFLTKIGTYTVSFGSYLEVEIYDDFDGVNLSNLLTSIPEQYCDYPGFWSLELPEPLRIKNGDGFYIKVKYNSPGCDYPIAIEGVNPGYTNPVLETGKCWTSDDAVVWEAAGFGTVNEFDLCIKAFGYDITKIDLKVMLEGPFNGTDMNTDLNAVLPLSQPYFVNPWNYNGTETVTGIPNQNIVDWVLVELRDTTETNSATEATVIARQAAFLLNDGSIVGIDGYSILKFSNSITHQLFVVVYHRNHIPVMSAFPVTETDGVYEYNFTDAIDKAFGGADGYKDLGNGVYGMIGGDGLATGSINEDDKTGVWEPQAGEAGYKEGDFNLNRKVNNPDKNEIWLLNIGSSSQVPE